MISSNLDFHRDIDENLYKDSSEIKFPINGHVLYLNIGSNCIGPTCLLNEENIYQSKPIHGDFIVCPCVNGRLLRFDGTMMHSVVRPELGYMDKTDGGSNHELWQPTTGEDESYERAVLLFNTWSSAPLGIQPMSRDTTTTTSTTTATTAIGSKNKNQNENEVNPKSSWKEQSIKSPGEGEGETSSMNEVEVGEGEGEKVGEGSFDTRLKVGLLGDRKRRENRSMRFMKLVTNNAGHSRTAFQSNEQCYSFPIKEM